MSRRRVETIKADHKGFTLVELLISIAILAIVIASVCSFILVGSRSYASANSDISVQQEAQTCPESDVGRAHRHDQKRQLCRV